MWQAVWEFQQRLDREGWWTHETVCVEATRLLAERAVPPYRHLVVDEAQDLSAVQWRLLRAAVPDGPDDVFIAGDTHQRIYANRVTLRDVGMRVTGRSTRLTVNYRTTAEILAWSLGMLRGETIDDMEGGLESVAGYRSEVHGLPPDQTGHPGKAAELDALADRVRGWLADGVAATEIGVAARSNALANDALNALIRAGVRARSLAGHGGQDEPTVQVGTMHRMKGLEFRCLAVVGVTSHLVPPASAITPVEEDELTHAHDLQRERCLLFVACTRAREQLAVSWHGTPSPFLSPTR